MISDRQRIEHILHAIEKINSNRNSEFISISSAKFFQNCNVA